MKTIAALASLSLAILYSSASYADTFGSDSNTFDIEFVTIGNPGNAADTTGDPNQAGKVDYTYRMGQFEISEEMIDKANLQSLADGDPLGITKDTRGPDKPATSVSWLEAAQFVNWLNTNSGNTPAYKFVSGNFQLWESGDAGYNPNNLFRNSQAKYVLPSVHEWYKAAYYDPTAGVYYDYPTGSDSVPDGIDFAGDTTFDAVFNNHGGFSPQPNDITDVGVLSPYGTAGQGGNVYEWEETERDLVNDSTSSDRGVRGADWGSISSSLSSSKRFNDVPANGFVNVGFRVASIPEPTTCTLALAVFCLVVGIFSCPLECCEGERG